jgi:hypothetical protein
VDGSDNGRGSVEGVEGGAFGAVVFRKGKQRFQLLAQGLPAGILVTTGDRVGEDRQGDRSETGEAGERLFLLRSGQPLFLLDFLNGADGGDYVAGFGFFATGNGRRWLFGDCVWRGGRIDSFVGCDRRRWFLRRFWRWFWLGGGRVYRNGVKQRRLVS